MAMEKQIRFHMYRYQILPVSQYLQHDWLNDRFSSIEELVDKKNEFFAEAITHIEQFEYARADLVHQVVYDANGIIVLRIGVNRDISRSTRDFREETVENWPNILLAFNNAPDVQKLAVQQDYRAFQGSGSVVHILERSLNSYLRRYHLHVRFMPIFERQAFWDIVEKYSTRIIQVEFEMISPNMSNISDSLRFDLRAIRQSTNAQETDITLKSDGESHLTLRRDDEFIGSLVDYSSKGGGNASIKVRGMKHKIQTENSITETSVDEIEVTGQTGGRLASLFRQLLQP